MNLKTTFSCCESRPLTAAPITVLGFAVCTSPVSGSACQGCAIVRSFTSNPGSTNCNYHHCATKLTSQYNTSLSTLANNSIVPGGTIEANRTGTISSVSSFLSTCPTNPTGLKSVTTTSPSACDALTGQFGINGVTAATVSTINVAAGQMIQVTVPISFS